MIALHNVFGYNDLDPNFRFNIIDYLPWMLYNKRSVTYNGVLGLTVACGLGDNLRTGSLAVDRVSKWTDSDLKVGAPNIYAHWLLLKQLKPV